jgi:hypothetical protein
MTLHQLANVFMLVHADYQWRLPKARGGDLCLTIAAEIALDLEQASNKTLWETFVFEPLRAHSSRLLSSPP